jgi:ligand-binding sensor domain-containing protein
MLEDLFLRAGICFSGKNYQILILLILMGLKSINSIGQQAVLPFGDGIRTKIFHSATVDAENTVWFLTESGLVSFDGKKWSLQNTNPKLASTEMKDLTYDLLTQNRELWIATPKGVIVAVLPINSGSEATTYYKDNSGILSDNVLALASGKGLIRWFGTDKGISALMDKKWLTNSYQKTYPEKTFQFNSITSLATSPSGDTLYAGTAGAGVFRVFRNDVDGISGASEYAEWGPILVPSDNVQCVYIEPDGTQWVGTDKGVAKHVGYETLENWFAYTTTEGLVDNYVQAINSDGKGNIWFGTKNGVSVFDGTKWTSFKVENGLVSNNVLSIAIDKNGSVWLGTDNGVSNINNGKFTNYQ